MSEDSSNNTDTGMKPEHDDLNTNVLLALYSEYNSSRIDYNTIKWRTVRIFSSINGTFLTVTVALLAYKNGDLSIYAKNLLFILPVSVVIISILGALNLKRESLLLWEQEASMFKIEKYLDLHNEIPEEKRWLTCDPYLVPPRSYNTRYKKEEAKEEWSQIRDWIDFRWKRHKFRLIINGVFYVEAFVAIILICVMVFLKA